MNQFVVNTDKGFFVGREFFEKGEDTISKHTPGPWRVVDSSFSFPHLLVRAPQSDKAIADCDFQRGDEGAANARLVAAAPELLEALREIHKLYLCPTPRTKKDWSARVDVMADYARKAIAKAEG